MDEGATSRMGAGGGCVGAGGCGVGVGGCGVGVGVSPGVSVGVGMKVGVGVRVGVGWLLAAGEAPQAASRQAMREQQNITVSFLANCIRWGPAGPALARENRE